MLLSIVRAKASEGKEVDFKVEINLDNKFVEDKNYKFLTSALVQGKMVFNIDKLYINATISFKLLAICDKCGEEFEKVLSFPFNEVFVDSTKAHSEEDYIILNQTCVDLSKAVEDALLLSLPTKMLCKENCKGLCSICGKNKNLYECDCNKIVEDNDIKENLFSVLKNNYKEN